MFLRTEHLSSSSLSSPLFPLYLTVQTPRISSFYPNLFFFSFYFISSHFVRAPRHHSFHLSKYFSFYLFLYVCHMCAGTCGGQRRISYLPELELQAVLKCLAQFEEPISDPLEECYSQSLSHCSSPHLNMFRIFYSNFIYFSLYILLTCFSCVH